MIGAIVDKIVDAIKYICDTSAKNKKYECDTSFKNNIVSKSCIVICAVIFAVVAIWIFG